MKTLTTKFWAKAVAVALTALFAYTVLGCVFGFIVFQESDAYLDDGASLRREATEALAYHRCTEVAQLYQDAQDPVNDPAAADRFSEENSNFFFTVTDADGNELWSNYTARSQAHAQAQFSVDLQTPLFVDGYIRADLKADDSIRAMVHLTDRLIALRYAIFWIGGIAVLALITLVVFLICAAGRRQQDDEIHLSWFDRIPFDLLLGIGLLGIIALIYALDGSVWVVGILLLLPLGLYWLALLMSFAVRAKTGTLWQNNLITMALKLCWRMLKWLFGALRDLVLSLPLFWRTLVIWGGVAVLELFLIVLWGTEDAASLWFIEKVILTPLLFFAVIAMQRLQNGAKCIADGDLTHTVDLTHMYGAFRQHGEYLNSISDGLQTAVDERVKSERMKAELITNVSHDIKTPLTSIVNYVDLLKKEPPANAQAAEYLNVLDRQSQRLKKLTEDLVEASKASTGSIAVHLERTDLNVLLGQAAGEFADRFEVRKLETVRTAAPEQPRIMADGQLLWRVFSNLLSNIYKHAMEGTRVYLSTSVDGGTAVVTFRNISGEALNVTAEELTERFVRGDRARSGEGSGLGLSIAKSLTELMGGAFTVTVDGDLFKVELKFPLIS